MRNLTSISSYGQTLLNVDDVSDGPPTPNVTMGLSSQRASRPACVGMDGWISLAARLGVLMSTSGNREGQGMLHMESHVTMSILEMALQTIILTVAQTGMGAFLVANPKWTLLRGTPLLF